MWNKDNCRGTNHSDVSTMRTIIGTSSIEIVLFALNLIYACMSAERSNKFVIVFILLLITA